MAVNTNLGISVSQLPTVANIAVTDSLVVLSNTTGNASVRTIQFGMIGANIVFAQTTPTNSSSPGLQGTIAYDNNWFYICTNIGWRRIAHAAF